jgi:hypothetical protein
MIAGVILYGIYSFMPFAGDGNPITEFILKYHTPNTVWAEMNTERTMAHTHFAEGKLISQTAQRPVIQRSRFPRLVILDRCSRTQSHADPSSSSLLEQASPRNVGVGENVDVTNFVAKRDGQ